MEARFNWFEPHPDRATVRSLMSVLPAQRLRQGSGRNHQGTVEDRVDSPQTPQESVELVTLQWVHWFNHTQLLAPTGGIPPAEAEANDCEGNTLTATL